MVRTQNCPLFLIARAARPWKTSILRGFLNFGSLGGADPKLSGSESGQFNTTPCQEFWILERIHFRSLPVHT